MKYADFVVDRFYPADRDRADARFVVCGCADEDSLPAVFQGSHLSA